MRGISEILQIVYSDISSKGLPLGKAAMDVELCLLDLIE
jgi:hypothetical protein